MPEAHKRYELGYHLSPAVGEEGLTAAVGELHTCIQDAGGEVVSEQWPESFTLAYTLSKKEEGKRKLFDSSYFGWIVFTGSPEAADKARKALGDVSSLLRSLVVGVTPESAPKRALRSVLADTPEAPEKDKSQDDVIDREIAKLVVE